MVTVEDKGNATCRLESRERGAVAWITLDHPGKMNAMGSAMIESLLAIFAELRTCEELRVVVIAGAGGRAFIGGAFVPELHGLVAETSNDFITRLHHANQAVRDCPVPVIACVRGYCIGGGTEFAAACDFRIADTTAIFGMPEVKVGMASVIEAAYLPRLVGWGKAREMLLTGDNFDAEEGKAMGFFQHVCEPAELDRLIETKIAQILAAGRKAVRAQKELLNAWEEMSPAEGIQMSIDYMRQAYETGEPHQMLAPLRNKR